MQVKSFANISPSKIVVQEKSRLISSNSGNEKVVKSKKSLQKAVKL